MVDFVLVGSLVIVLAMAVVQLTLALHVRTTLIDSASEGARYGAVDGRTTADAVARTRELVSAALSDAYTGDVTARRVASGGAQLVEVTVRAPLPVIGLVGPSGVVEVRGHAIAEDSMP